LVLGYDALQTGLLVLPTSAAMMVAMPLGAAAYRRVGPVAPILGGMLLAGFGMVLLGQIDASTEYGDLWAPLAVVGLGVGLAVTPLNLAALNAAPQRQHGAIGAVILTLSGLGSGFGIALTGALFQTLWKDNVRDKAAQAGVSISGDAAGKLTGLLSGTPSATDALNAFPAGTRPALSGAVRIGFFDAFDSAMLLSAAIAAVGIAAAAALVRSRPPVEAAVTPEMAEALSGAAPGA
jgi:DHA2 family methylenomycin A resistance protein-like MFS transporter